jgi:hypothetical protein
MSMSAGPSARLLFRVDPEPRESPRGYLCRVADAHHYGGPLSLAQIASLSACDLEREERVKQRVCDIEVEVKRRGVPASSPQSDR